MWRRWRNMVRHAWDSSIQVVEVGGWWVLSMHGLEMERDILNQINSNSAVGMLSHEMRFYHRCVGYSPFRRPLVSPLCIAIQLASASWDLFYLQSKLTSSSCTVPLPFPLSITWQDAHNQVEGTSDRAKDGRNQVLRYCMEQHSLPHIQKLSGYTFGVHGMLTSESDIVLEELMTDLWIINTHRVGECHAFNFGLKLPAKNIFPKE